MAQLRRAALSPELEMQKDNYLLSAWLHHTVGVRKSISSGQNILIGIGAMAISVLDERSPHPDMAFC